MLHTWASWIRTSDCRSQSPVPYRLAIAHYIISYYKIRGWVVGLEPTISRTTIWRADQLHHTHHISVLGGIRTPDPRLRRPLLYPTELQTHILLFLNVCFRKAGDGNRTHVSSLEGWCSTIELHPHNYRGDRIRTCHLLVPNQAL